MKVKRIPLLSFQKALYKNLSECQSTAVFDHIPTEQEDVHLPYITLGAATIKPNGSKDKDIYDCSIQIHAWSEYEGRAEINNMMNDIANVLSLVPLDMGEDKFLTVNQEVTFFEAYEGEYEGYHGVVTFNTIIQDMI